MQFCQDFLFFLPTILSQERALIGPCGVGINIKIIILGCASAWSSVQILALR